MVPPLLVRTGLPLAELQYRPGLPGCKVGRQPSAKEPGGFEVNLAVLPAEPNGHFGRVTKCKPVLASSPDGCMLKQYLPKPDKLCFDGGQPCTQPTSKSPGVNLSKRPPQRPRCRSSYPLRLFERRPRARQPVNGSPWDSSASVTRPAAIWATSWGR